MIVNVLLADDHKIVRDGLRTLIEQVPGMEIVGEAENGRDAVKLARKYEPHVIIMDVTMPGMNGIEAAKKIHSLVPGARVIGLSMHSDHRFVLGMLEAGASGYLLKDCAFEELANAIRHVAAGGTYLSPRIDSVVVEEYLQKSSEEVRARKPRLTPREKEILQLIAEGMSVKMIAARLNLSLKTIESHRHNTMEKLDKRSIAELTTYAIQEGLVTIDG